MRQHPLLSYVILTFGITWGLAACFVLFPAQIAATFGKASVSNPLFLLAVYAPSISAVIMTGVTGGPSGIGSLLARLLRWRVRVRWYAAALLGLPVLSSLATVMNAAASGSLPRLEHGYDLFLRGPSGLEILQVVGNHHVGWTLLVSALAIVFVSDPGPLDSGNATAILAPPRFQSDQLPSVPVQEAAVLE
jgi:hypothetical protein